MSTKRRAVFFDRDGVINDVLYRGENFFINGKQVVWSPPWKHEEFRLKEGVEEVLEHVRGLGFLRILVTNQPDVAYGNMTAQEFNRIMDDVRRLSFDAIYVCPHTRDEGCECKKPKPGMFLRAADEHGIDLTASYMIGDRDVDLIPMKELGGTTILISADRGDIEADKYIKTLLELTEII